MTNFLEIQNNKRVRINALVILTFFVVEEICDILTKGHKFSKKINFTKGRLITDNFSDIIKKDNIDDEDEFRNLEKLRSNKTDDFIGIKESPSKKYFQIENNINRKKRRTLVNSTRNFNY